MNAHMKHANLRRRMHDIAEQREILRRCAIPHMRHGMGWHRMMCARMRHTALLWAWIGDALFYSRVGGRDYTYRVNA
jgi:hypothetical protein